MTPILTIPPLPSLLEQLAEDGLNGPPMLRIRLVERHHVHEDDVALVHEEVAEEVEAVGFARATDASVDRPSPTLPYLRIQLNATRQKKVRDLKCV